eukprot:TRINITY_DN27438_c0_g1_i2.p1 TRINITY_DN27438_c0_g1~~TRINITY_DN27438_c0_g1_i2.p1  ORF type:complete len:190 (+),score=34.76 TRINITY_DN27438_c0_g1_i2:452-1021(+)
MMDATVYNISGGIYLPQVLMKSALERKTKFEEREATGVRLSPAGAGAKHGGGIAARNAGVGALMGTSGGAAVTGLIAFISTGLVTASTGAIYTTIGISAAGGAAAGAVGGAVIGAVVGGVAGTVGAISKYAKYRRELALSMTQKIVDKLHCHSKFKFCGRDSKNVYIMVPKATSSCPTKDNHVWKLPEF